MATVNTPVLDGDHLAGGLHLMAADRRRPSGRWPPLDTSCALCGRRVPLYFHHLIPRTCHSNKWFKRHFSKEDMKTRGIEVCRDCHKFIHRHFTEKELGRRYNTRDLLLRHEGVQKFIRWVRKKT